MVVCPALKIQICVPRVFAYGLNNTPSVCDGYTPHVLLEKIENKDIRGYQKK